MFLKNISKKLLLTLTLLGMATPSFANDWGHVNDARGTVERNDSRDVSSVQERDIIQVGSELRVKPNYEIVEAPKVTVTECLSAQHHRDQACLALTFFCGLALEASYQNGTEFSDAERETCHEIALSCQEQNNRVVASCSMIDKPISEYEDDYATCDQFTEAFNRIITEIVYLLSVDHNNRDYIRYDIGKLIKVISGQKAHCEIR